MGEDFTKKFIREMSLRYQNDSIRHLDGIASTDEYNNWKEEVKQLILEALGGLPEKSPLKPEIISRINLEYFTVENILLYPLPEIPLNLNLFLPSGGIGPFPLILFATGHSSKTDLDHQIPVQGLARMGFAVALFDSLGRGERSDGNEHFDIGPLSWLNGFCMNRYFINDGMRVLDYLCSRTEIDGGKIGCTGISGGGNTVIYHAALDDRIICAVPVCTLSSQTDMIVNGYTACPEYFPIGMLKSGIDIHDLIAAITPRPFLFLAGGKDIIRVPGSMENACGIVSKKCDQLGISHETDYFLDIESEHCYSKNMRERMYNFFYKHLLNGDVSITEPELTPLPPETLNFFFRKPNKTLLDYERDMLFHKNRILSGSDILDLCGITSRRCEYKTEGEQQIRINKVWSKQASITTGDCNKLEINYYHPVSGVCGEGIYWLIGPNGKNDLYSDYSYLGLCEKGYIVAAADLRPAAGPTPWDGLPWCSAEKLAASQAVCVSYPIIGQRLYDLSVGLKYLCDTFPEATKRLTLSCSGFSACVIGMLAEQTLDFPEIAYMGERVNYRRFFEDNTEKINYGDILPGFTAYCDIDGYLPV